MPSLETLSMELYICGFESVISSPHFQLAEKNWDDPGIFSKLSGIITDPLVEILSMKNTFVTQGLQTHVFRSLISQRFHTSDNAVHKMTQNCHSQFYLIYWLATDLSSKYNSVKYKSAEKLVGEVVCLCVYVWWVWRGGSNQPV